MKIAGAVLAFGASSAANAGITIPAGDWTVDIGGNVNAYYTNTRYSGDLERFYKATKNSPGSKTSNTISTGLLPSALGIGAKSRQNDLDIAFQFTFFTGVDSSSDGANGFNSNGAGSNSLNIRQAYLSFGDASWGTIKMGRDLGVFGSDAILNDMTLLGVGTGAGGNGSSTLGRIGSGYVYADWVGQIQYASPNWNGFSFAVAAREPWRNELAGVNNEQKSKIGFDGKVSYEWAGDYAGKVWAGFVSQKHDNDVAVLDYTSRGWEIGGKVSAAGFGLVGYYYDGKGLNTQTGQQLGGLQFLGGNKTDDDGGYVQATYTLPSVGTKLGVSYGISNSEDRNAVGGTEFENKSWIIGAYHPLTKSLNLVAEYTHQKVEVDIPGLRSVDGKAKTISLGAILFF